MPIRVDERLIKIASLIDGDRVADIGCDHGKLSYYLIGHERAKSVIATDISVPSLSKARTLAQENGVTDLIETRLGDGLCPIVSREVDTVVIAGMGGDLIARILLDGAIHNKQFHSFVLAPNTHAEKVRRMLHSIGHNIVEDDILTVSHKTYNIIKSVEGKSEPLDECQLEFGKHYLTSNNFKHFAEQEIASIESILKNTTSQKLEERMERLKKAIT